MHVIKDNKQKTYWVTWTGIGQVQHEEWTSTDSVAQPWVVVAAAASERLPPFTSVSEGTSSGSAMSYVHGTKLQWSVKTWLSHTAEGMQSYLRGHIMCHVPEQLVLVGWWVFLRETGYFFKENFTRLPLTTPHPVGYLQENKTSWDFFSSCRSDPSSAAWLSIECLDFDAYEVAIPLFHTSWTVKVLFNIWVSICINVMESELTFSHLDLSLSLNKDFAW